MDTPAHLGHDILNAWIDNVATDQECAVVRDHVATCDICAQRLDELRGVRAMLASLSDTAPPRSFQLTAEQAMKPGSIRPSEAASEMSRLLPVVRTLSVAAMLAVLVLGGVLAFGTSSDTMTSQNDVAMESGETSDPPLSFQMQEPPPAAMERGEMVDQGASASAHDSTSDALADEAQETVTAASDSNDGISTLLIATIAVGVLAIIFGGAWIWMTLSIRNGASR